MAVITISRLTGSGGYEIGKEAAKSLGYKFVDKDFIQKVLNKYGHIGFTKLYYEEPNYWARYLGIVDSMVEMFKKVILSIAKSQDVVIVGRGSFADLSGHEDVLNVMIYAPTDQRIRAVMKKKNMDKAAEAEKFIIRHDKMRESFIEYFHKMKWDRIGNFDLVFNTGKLKPSYCTEMIVSAAKNLDQQAPNSFASVSKIPDDEVLDRTVKTLLETLEPAK